MSYCSRAHKVIFKTEIDAKLALFNRQRKEKGEQRYYPCGKHFHLTSQTQKTEPKSRTKKAS